MTTSTELVTVLMPTFQRSSLLLRAIRSVQAQSYPNLLISIYDNASTDDTELMVNELCIYDSRIRYYRHKTNIGVIPNYSFALAEVSTPYFTFLADDDVIYPDCIRHAVCGLNSNLDVVFWGGNTLHINGDTGAVIRGTGWSWRRGGIYSSLEACLRICSGNHMEFQGLVFRTSMVHETKEANFRVEINLPDVDFQLRLAARHRVGATREVTAAMYAHKQSSSSGVRNLSSYWPTMKYIGERFIAYNTFAPQDAWRCKKIWDRTTILNIIFLTEKWKTSTNQDLRTTIIRILRDDYSNYLLAHIGQFIVKSFALRFPIPALVWLGFKIIYILFRPRILLNRLMPFCLSAHRKLPNVV